MALCRPGDAMARQDCIAGATRTLDRQIVSRPYSFKEFEARCGGRRSPDSGGLLHYWTARFPALWNLSTFDAS